MSSTPTRQLAAALALFALGWAQLFGLSRGYLCACSGAWEITVFDHCHGPHAFAAHDHDDADPHHGHHDETDLPADSDTHHHAPVTETLVSLGSAAQTVVAAPSAAPLVPVLHCLWVANPFGSAIGRRPMLSPDDGGGGGRRWPRMLAHAIALRV